MDLGRSVAGCGGRRPSCAKVGIDIAFTKARPGADADHYHHRHFSGIQKSRGDLRLHRLHRPPIREKPIPAMAFRISPRGRKTATRTQTRAMRTVAAKATSPTVRDNPLKNNAADGADGTDANLPAPIWAGKNREAPGWSTRL